MQLHVIYEQHTAASTDLSVVEAHTLTTGLHQQAEQNMASTVDDMYSDISHTTGQVKRSYCMLGSACSIEQAGDESWVMCVL